MKLRLVLVGLCLFVLSLTAFAQETVEWGDLGIVIDVPDDWGYDDSGENALLVVYNDTVAIYMYEPRDARNAERAIDQLIDNNAGTEFEFEDPFEIELMGEEAWRVDYTSPGFTGFSIAFEFDDNVLLLDAGVFDDRLRSRDEDDLLEVIATLRPADEDSGSSGGDVIETAADLEAGDDIVDELIDLDLVGDDGDFIFEEDEIEEDTEDLPESYEGGNIAIGAVISYEQPDDDEYYVCGFLAQSTTDDMNEEEGALLITALDRDGFLVTFDLDIADIEGSNFEAHEADFDIEDENHLLMLVENDEVAVYINGELVLEGWELDFSAGDDERFAGFIADMGCTMTDVWAYAWE